MSCGENHKPGTMSNHLIAEKNTGWVFEKWRLPEDKNTGFCPDKEESRGFRTLQRAKTGRIEVGAKQTQKEMNNHRK